MADPLRRLRGLVYTLADVETALRTGGRSVGAETVRLAALRFSEGSPQEFLDQSRTALESVLLGERDLPADTIGLVLDLLASLDEALRELMV